MQPSFLDLKRMFPAAKNPFAAQAGLLLGMLGLIAAFFYFPAISKINIVLGDEWSVEYGTSFFFKSQISRGIFPFWNPDSGFGVPEWIPISPFSLDRLLLVFMSPQALWTLLKPLNFILSGWLLSLYLLRRINLLFPAFLGGLMLSVALLNVNIGNASYFLFVLSFLMAGRLVISRSYFTGLILAVLLYLFFASVVPQNIICATLFLFAYIAIRFRLYRSLSFRSWLLALFPFMIAFMLFAPQVLRVKELLDLSARAEVVGKEVFFIPPWGYLQMIWPNWLMNSQDPSLNFIPGRMIAALQSGFLKCNGVVFGEAPYYGILPFFAVACLFFKRDLRFFEKGLLLLVSLMLFLPVINPILDTVTKHIPIFSIASGAMLFGTAYGASALLLVVSILTALLLGYLSDSRSFSQFNLRGLKRFFIGIAAFVLFFSAVRLVIFAALHFGGSPIRELLERILIPVFTQDRFHQSPEFYKGRVEQLFLFLKLWASPQNVYFYTPVLFILGSIGILYGRLTGKVGKTFFLLAGFLLIMLDAAFFRPLSFHDPNGLTPLKEEAEFIKKDKTIFRVMALQDNSRQANDAKSFDTRHVILRPETHLIYGLSSAECYKSAVIKDYNRYMSRMVEGSRGRIVGEFSAIKDLSLLDLANIKYVVAPLSIGADSFPEDHFERVYQTERCNVFKNKSANDRAFLLFPKEGSRSAMITQYSPHRVRVSVRTDIPNELVLTDQYYPGWVASVDGVRTPVTSFQGPFRKVAVPGGQHEVEFKFQPAYLSRGMLIPLLGILIGIFAVFFEWKFPVLVRGDQKGAEISKQ